MELYLAGCNASDPAINRIITEGRITNGFVSYYYARSNKNKSVMPFFRSKMKRVIIDSGAHTFFSEAEDFTTGSVLQKTTKTKITPDQYMAEYLEWLVTNKDCFDYFVELDIGELVGQTRVEEWRKLLSSKNLDHKMITVYHPAVMSWEDYIALLDASVSRYVALEGLRGGKSPIPYVKFIRAAYERRVRVHGFAMVKNKWLQKYPFTSVDSTSWKAGPMYGVVTVPDAESKRKSVKPSKGLVHALDAGGIVGPKDLEMGAVSTRPDHQYNMMVAAIQGMTDRETYFTNLWKARGVDWDA